MRRKTVLFLCLLTSMAGILSGCGGNKTGETNVTLETLAEDPSGSPTITSDAGTIQFKGTTSKDEVYDFGYKASDYISLGDYSNIKVEQTPSEEVTDDEIQSRISDLMKKKEIWIDKTEGSINRYDLVNLDIICTVDGKEYTPGSKKDMNLNVGAGNYFSEFEEKLIGKQLGDTITFELALPDNDTFTQQAGKKGVFTVYLKAVRTQPQLTDEIAVKLSDQKYQSVKEYQQYIKEMLEAEKEEQHNYNVFMEVMTQIADSIDIKEIPEEESENDLTYEKIQQEADAKGIAPAELAQEYEVAGKKISMDSTEEHSMDLLILYIADQNGITVTGGDIAEYKSSLLERGTYSEEELDKTLSERKLAHLALNRKVLAFVAECAEN
ncbi:hypothetical protein [Ruminococcus sp. AF20-12LB]|uniref:hypothetical protein n=2 Tax=Clostridia TaxID=186801 RepID=UPI000E4D6E44|nr:hypothetical protein [Ruminococcus sp. AF20-12LB]RHR06500.1 hypothetical protein DWX61_08405 [Ruminococcus sp. AF20-12LB]